MTDDWTRVADSERIQIIGERRLHITETGEEVWNSDLPSLNVIVVQHYLPERRKVYSVWCVVGSAWWKAMKRARGWEMGERCAGSDLFKRPVRPDEAPYDRQPPPR